MGKLIDDAVEYQLKTYGPNVIGGDAILSDEEFKLLNTNKDFRAGEESMMETLNQVLIDWRNEAKTEEEKESRFEAHKRFFEIYDRHMIH